MKICDKCKKVKSKLTELVINKNNFELCNDCLNSIVKSIKGSKKQESFLDRMKTNLENLNG